VDAYIEGKRLHCSPRSIEFEDERLITLKRCFGDVPLTDITAKAIADYQRQRHEVGKANRTINMDVGVLSRVLKSCGRWRALLEHYSHIRIDAKRQALDALDESRRAVHNDGGTSGDAEASVDSPSPTKSSRDLPLLVALSDSLTSQSRHSLALAGSPPSAKLSIPLDRRDGRVAEGARLETDSGHAR
jgi:hypothetical protein